MEKGRACGLRFESIDDFGGQESWRGPDVTLEYLGCRVPPTCKQGLKIDDERWSQWWSISLEGRVTNLRPRTLDRSGCLIGQRRRAYTRS